MEKNRLMQNLSWQSMSPCLLNVKSFIKVCSLSKLKKNKKLYKKFKSEIGAIFTTDYSIDTLQMLQTNSRIDELKAPLTIQNFRNEINTINDFIDYIVWWSSAGYLCSIADQAIMELERLSEIYNLKAHNNKIALTARNNEVEYRYYGDSAKTSAYDRAERRIYGNGMYMKKKEAMQKAQDNWKGKSEEMPMLEWIKYIDV